MAARTPTLEDARKGAEILSGFEGVRVVGLFGSVARGEASEGSDLDYLVLGNYDEPVPRYLADRMKSATLGGVDISVDVCVRDVDYWLECSATRSLFEARIAPDVVCLFGRPEVLADATGTKRDSGMARLRAALVEAGRIKRALSDLLQSAEPNRVEQDGTDWFRIT